MYYLCWIYYLEIDIAASQGIKKMTHFSTHEKHLQFRVMPFGLTSTPLTLVRLMQVILGEVPNVFCFLNDLIIYSQSIEQHFIYLERVLKKLKEAV